MITTCYKCKRSVREIGSRLWKVPFGSKLTLYLCKDCRKKMRWL